MTDDVDTVSPAEAKARIDDAAFGYVVTGDITTVPTLGEVDIEDMKAKVDVETVRFENDEVRDDRR